MQNHIIAFGVDVFSIDEKSIHVKETGADSRESGKLSVSSTWDWRIRKAYSGFAIIMMAVLLLSMADIWLVRFVFEVEIRVGAVN